MGISAGGAGYKFLVMMVGMLCGSSALAESYFIPADYRGKPSGLCQTLRNALAEGMVLDAKRPLCERRFDLSSRAERLGLSSVKKALLPSSVYPDLLRNMMPIIGQQSLPLSDAHRAEDEAAVNRLMKSGTTRIWVADFDEDNGGKTQKTYLLEDTSCDIPDSAWDGNFTVFVERSDGTMDPAWGASNAAAGLPFAFKRHTYYAKWMSMRGSMVKSDLAELNIYDSSPFDPSHGSYAGFTPSYCKIFQDK